MQDVGNALKALGIFKPKDMGNMSRAEIDRVVKVATQYKKAGQFRAYWANFNESVNLMDHRHWIGGGHGELEAEVSLGLLLNLRCRPLDAERDHAQRAGVLAGLAGLRRRSPGQRARTGDRGRGDTTLDEEIAASHATLLVCGLGACQTLVLTDLGRELASIDFELRHEPNSFLLAALPRI